MLRGSLHPCSSTLDLLPYKHIELPRSNYAAISFDRVELGGRIIGFSSSSGYSHNERSMLSMAVIDPEIPVGEEVTLVWERRTGHGQGAQVERHRQTTIKAIVSSAPYSKVAREDYTNTGWRKENR